MTTAAVIAVVGLVASAVGTGISYSAQSSAAKSQAQFATLNAAAGLQQAQAAGRQQAAQAQLQAAAADARKRSALNNAEAMRAKVDADSRVAQENIRRSRAEFAANLARQRATAAGSGVVDTTGSPLSLLVSASEDQALFESEQRWADENQRRAGRRQADAVELGGQVEGLNASLHEINGMAALADARLQGSQIRLNQFSSLASARGAQSAATAGLVSGFGSSALQASDAVWKYRTPKTAQ